MVVTCSAPDPTPLHENMTPPDNKQDYDKANPQTLPFKHFRIDFFFFKTWKNTKAHWYRKKDEKKDENTKVCSSEHRNIFQGRIILFPCRTDTVMYMRLGRT